MTSSAMPLDGVRILDLSRILAGPFCTQLLGDLGADVIKVERPGRGDDTRSWGPPFVKGADGTDTRESAYYLSANRNKRSLSVDMTTEEGQAELRELLRHCDVLVENFKQGGLAKYGLSYADLAEEFPGLVYCSITGFGQTGPNAHRAGYDLMAQGYGGIMSLTGVPDGEPMKVAVGICDVMTGMYAANAIQAALRHRDRTGEGQQIDVALVDVQMAWLVNEGNNYLLSGQLPKRQGNQHPNIVPYQVFEGADGHLIVAVGNDRQFQEFCDILGVPELAADPRYATNPARLSNRDELIDLLCPLIAGWDCAALLDAMEERAVPGGPINRLDQVYSSEQAAARDMVVHMDYPDSAEGQVPLLGNPLKLSRTPVRYNRPPPRCGEHNDEIRVEFGLGSQKDSSDA